MLICAPKETVNNEQRAALTPVSVVRLIKAGHAVRVQEGLGEAASFSDADYAKAGATVISDSVDKNADMVVKVTRPTDLEMNLLKPGVIVTGILGVRTDPTIAENLAKAGVTAFAMEMVPRIARAQSLDVLSSQASLAGYKAALIAAGSITKYFPMLITAAGTVPPVHVLVIGAGVAGLQAIATARRLGAVVKGFDVRAAAGEQVRSLGADFISPPESTDAETTGGYARQQTEVEQERIKEFIAKHVATADAVITTAAVPGKRAPMLITTETVRNMRPGSVIVDAAADTGGNCEATKPGKIVNLNGVNIHGPLNLPSQMASHASVLYGHNIAAFTEIISGSEGTPNIDFEDEVVKAMCVAHNGETAGQFAQAA